MVPDRLQQDHTGIKRLANLQRLPEQKKVLILIYSRW